MQSLKARLYTLLRWSEKYTKTDMVYLAGGGFWLSSGQILTTAIGFGASIAFAYLLPKTAYGDYRYILSVFAILSAFTLTGINTAIIQSVASGFDGSLRQGFQLSFRWSFWAVFGAIIGSAYYFFRDNSFLGSSLLLVAIVLPFIHSWGLYAGFINGKKDFRRLSIYNLVDNAAPTLVVLGTLFITKNILVLLSAYFLTTTVMAYFFYRRTLSVYNPLDTHDQDLASYSLKLSTLNVVGIVTTHLDKVIVYTAMGSAELAIYAFATAFPDQIRSVLKNLNTLMVPKFTEHGNEGTTIQLQRKFWQLLVLVVAITIVYLLTAPLLYGIFFPKYPESVFFSKILSLSILSALAMIPSALFIAQKREKELAKATIFGSVFQIAILVPSIYLGGLVGLCIARVLGSYTNLAISYYLLHRQRRLA